MKNRVFVLALDGVGFPLITPWLEAGYLPNLQQLFSQGASGELTSTIPPLTGPAWSTFQTGVNPGKHGVLGWTKRRQYGISVVDASDIRYPTLWELASDNGKRVVSIGLPLTYPPRKVNGVIIPGMLVPKTDKTPSYPPEAYAELLDAAPGYRFFPECSHLVTLRAKLASLRSSVRGRTQAAIYFSKKEDWDLLMIHFQATDKAQHDLWGVNNNKPLLEIFKEVDHSVGLLAQEARKREATIILLSDHGMGPQDYTFSINTWLMNQGYLRLKEGMGRRIKQTLFQLGFTQRRLARLGILFYPLAYRLGAVNSFFDAVGEGWLARLINSLFLSLNDVDWKATSAYSHADVGHIRLNRVGREPEGIVTETEAEKLISELMTKLNKVVNPHTGEKLCGDVMRREEIYHGPMLEEAPDIVFLPRDLRTMGSGASGFYSNHLFDHALMHGNHRMQGVVTAVGEPFRSGFKLTGARLVDLAANILYLLNCPIPKYMDGALWKEALTSKLLTSRPPQYSEKEPLEAEDGSEREPGQEVELQRRLKGLGYLH
jgi:predicted AlkP superfamily phosphohydrolase/phosphomutase